MIIPYKHFFMANILDNISEHVVDFNPSDSVCLLLVKKAEFSSLCRFLTLHAILFFQWHFWDLHFRKFKTYSDLLDDIPIYLYNFLSNYQEVFSNSKF